MVTPQPNYVQLEPEKTKRLRFDGWNWDDREITDPKTRQVKQVKVMVLHATEEDGNKIDKPFSVLSYKLQQTLAPLIDTGALFTRLVSITWYPRGHATEYSVGLE
jgi:hypothetical protein